MNNNRGQTGVIFLIIFLMVLVGAALFFLLSGRFIFTGDSVFTGDCRDIVFPYEEREITSDFLDAEVTDVEDTEVRNSSSKSYIEAKVSLRNVDMESGWFTVTFVFETLDDGRRSREVRHFIRPDEIETFEYRYSVDFDEDVRWSYTYESDAASMSRVVTKYRTQRVCDNNLNLRY